MRQDELYEDMTTEQETETTSTVTSLDNQPKEKWLKKRTMYKVKVTVYFSKLWYLEKVWSFSVLLFFRIKRKIFFKRICVMFFYLEMNKEQYLSYYCSWINREKDNHV